MSSEEKQTAWASRPSRVLVVDDEEPMRKALGRILSSNGHEVSFAADGEEAIRILAGPPFDVVMTDLGMPGMTGLELLRAIRGRDLDVPVVILTGSPSVQSAIDAIEHGAMQYLVKPVAPEQLIACVVRAMRLGRIARAKREAMAEMVHPAVHAMGDRAALEAAFDRTMMTVWSAFQPIVRADGTLFGYEALLRSREPALPHPGAVLDAAEKLSRIHLLGRRMRALAALPVAADATSGTLFVNLHPEDLFDEELTRDDSPLMGIAERVVLEVTERAAIQSMERLRVRTAEIRACGFRLAIDDLGAGYAGLSAFAALEPEVVKLDMSLIRDIDRTPTKRKVVESMSRLCRDLGMQVVAEGVETVSELNCVLEAGCDLVQGYLLAKPGPAFPTVSWPGAPKGA
jgi:EAL domain-containing protein (putative c-di-GMP-specific phosphodiesterase class I)